MRCIMVTHVAIAFFVLPSSPFPLLSPLLAFVAALAMRVDKEARLRQAEALVSVVGAGS